ncbi:unnamed protein product [Lactuca virosa]|uniref:Uncharacterized protein n=1 Tax=Lactuca virosa TaxID=75947 RepID=A0AAU9N1Q8_9ASTR|nr:unnamed protein product [Lactuca virosa]
MEANTIPAPVNKQQSSKVSDIISENKEDLSAEEVDEEGDDAYQEGVEQGELPPLDNSDPLQKLQTKELKLDDPNEYVLHQQDIRLQTTSFLLVRGSQRVFKKLNLILTKQIGRRPWKKK